MKGAAEAIGIKLQRVGKALTMSQAEYDRLLKTLNKQEQASLTP